MTTLRTRCTVLRQIEHLKGHATLDRVCQLLPEVEKQAIQKAIYNLLEQDRIRKTGDKIPGESGRPQFLYIASADWEPPKKQPPARHAPSPAIDFDDSAPPMDIEKFIIKPKVTREEAQRILNPDAPAVNPMEMDDSGDQIVLERLQPVGKKTGHKKGRKNYTEALQTNTRVSLGTVKYRDRKIKVLRNLVNGMAPCPDRDLLIGLIADLGGEL